MSFFLFSSFYNNDLKTVFDHYKFFLLFVSLETFDDFFSSVSSFFADMPVKNMFLYTHPKYGWYYYPNTLAGFSSLITPSHISCMK